MIDERRIENDLKRSGNDAREVVSRHLTGVLKKISGNIWIPIDILTVI
jgi:hypothetical protein